METDFPVLAVSNLSHRFASSRGPIGVLEKIDLSIAPSQIVAATGESGSGKTTLLLACGGMLKPTAGSIVLNGQDLFELSSSSRAKFRASHIGFLFQTLELVPYLNLLDNVRLSQGVSREAASAWLQKLGLSDRMSHKPESLSHGQRQRAALARAIAHKPSLLIADEPTGNLDEKNSEIVFRTLREFSESGGSVLVASHDPQISSLADKLIDLDTTSAGVDR